MELLIFLKVGLFEIFPQTSQNPSLPVISPEVFDWYVFGVQSCLLTFGLWKPMEKKTKHATAKVSPKKPLQKDRWGNHIKIFLIFCSLGWGFRSSKINLDLNP